MVTKSQRKLCRTIRILEKSVELSAKESQAKESEKKYKESLERVKEHQKEGSVVQDLRDPQTSRKDSAVN